MSEEILFYTLILIIVGLIFARKEAEYSAYWSKHWFDMAVESSDRAIDNKNEAIRLKGMLEGKAINGGSDE